MARELFLRYEHGGRLEDSRALAPKVSRMSQAVIDSVSTCDGVQNGEWMVREAADLRDLCKKIVSKSK